MLSENSFFTIQEGGAYIWAPTQGGSNEITVLTMAVYGLKPDLAQAVIDFNKENGKYRIDVTDYEAFNTAEYSDEGWTLLSTEIIAGHCPDILELSHLPVKQYTSMGLLEDLTSFLTRESVLKLSPGLISALTENGHIYSLVPGFSIISTVGSSGNTPKDGKWSISELIEADLRAKETGKTVFAAYTTRESFLEQALAFSGDKFYNLDNAFCDFNCSDFADVLKYAGTLPSESAFDDEAFSRMISAEPFDLASGNQLFKTLSFGEPVTAYMLYNGIFKNSAVFSGFPCCGTDCAIQPAMRLGMSSTSENTDGVFSFFTFLLSENYQNLMCKYQYVPAVSQYIEEELQKEIERYQKEPPRFSLTDGNSEIIIECSVPSAGTLDEVRALVCDCSQIYEYDTTVYGIVIEEASWYFNGQRTVEEVAKIIQNRVNLYLSEQFQ